MGPHRPGSARRLATATSRLNRLHPGPPSSADRPRLADYLALVDYSVPQEAAAGHVGETVRILRPRLESGRFLTARQQERWDRLLEHNRHDCAGMRLVCLRATRELDATDD